MVYSHCPVVDTQGDINQGDPNQTDPNQGDTASLERRVRARMPLLNGSPTVEEIQERMAGLEDRLDAICEKTRADAYRDSQAKVYDLNRVGNDFAKLEYYLFLGNDSLSEFYPLLDLFVGRLQKEIAAARGRVAAGR